jgi:hypothetical protein
MIVKSFIISVLAFDSALAVLAMTGFSVFRYRPNETGIVMSCCESDLTVLNAMYERKDVLTSSYTFSASARSPPARDALWVGMQKGADWVRDAAAIY